MMTQRLLRSNWVLLLIIFSSGLLGILRFNSFQVGAFVDDAHYVVLAEGLASGQGYSLINFPGGHPERNFPPGWPLLLVPITAFFSGNFTVLKLVPFILWLISIVLVYKLFAKRMETPYLEIVVAFIALNPALIGESAMLMSEIAFLFFTLLTLNIFEYWNNKREKAGDRILILVAVTALYAQAVRTVGIAILLAIISYLLLKRLFRQVVIFLVMVSLGMGFQVWFNSQNGGGLIPSGYKGQVIGNYSPITKIVQIWQNIQSYSDEMIANSLIQVFGPNVTASLEKVGLGFVPVILNIVIILLIMLGIILCIRKFTVTELYVGFYFLGILSFWNPAVGSAQSRFLIPIIPFLYFYLFVGMLWIINRILPKKTQYVFPIVIVISSLVLMVSVVRNLQDWRNPIRNRITDLSIGRTWLRENSLPDSIILARDPVPDYLYIRRKTVAYPKNGQDIWVYLHENNIDYLILSPKLQTPRSVELDEFTKNQILPVIETNSDNFELVFENMAHGVLVYKVK
jgi:hypothetical protein